MLRIAYALISIPQFGMPKVRTGPYVFVALGFAALRGLRVGVVAHPASVDAHLRHILELVSTAPGVKLAAVFGPEHGLRGQAQDLISVAGGNAETLAVHSLYGTTAESLHP